MPALFPAEVGMYVPNMLAKLFHFSAILEHDYLKVYYLASYLHHLAGEMAVELDKL